MKTPSASNGLFETSVATALRVWSVAQHDEVSDLMKRLLSDWQGAWSLSDAEYDVPHISVQPASRTPASEQAVFWRFDDRPTSDLSESASRAVHAALFGGAPHQGFPSGSQAAIAPEIARMAWNDWQQRLESKFKAPLSPWTVEAEMDRATNVWSGALHVQVTWCGARCSLLIPCAVVQRLVRPRAAPAVTSHQALANLSDALHEQRLQVHVRLHDVTLTMGELEQLSPGDVVLLPHQLDVPLQVVAPDGEALCAAWLGQQAGQIALELSHLSA